MTEEELIGRNDIILKGVHPYLTRRTLNYSDIKGDSRATFVARRRHPKHQPPPPQNNSNHSKTETGFVQKEKKLFEDNRATQRQSKRPRRASKSITESNKHGTRNVL